MAPRSKAKKRAPLMESDTEDALRRRGTELIGLILIGIGALALLVIWTYSPEDPSLFSATDEAPRNALGIIGASLADPLHRALGWSAYGIPAVLGVWGLRLVLHAGETRVVSRTVAAPAALLAVSAFAATHVPPPGWSFDYGLGGLLGDAVLGFGLSLLPFALGPSLVLASLVLAALAAGSAGFALGVTGTELRRFTTFLRDGSILLYAALLSLTGRAAVATAAGARSGYRTARDAREARGRRVAAESGPARQRAHRGHSALRSLGPWRRPDARLARCRHAFGGGRDGEDHRRRPCPGRGRRPDPRAARHAAAYGGGGEPDLAMDIDILERPEADLGDAPMPAAPPRTSGARPVC